MKQFPQHLVWAGAIIEHTRLIAVLIHDDLPTVYHCGKRVRLKRARHCAERVRRVISGYKFEGTKTEVLLEEKIGLRTLKNATELLARIEAVRADAQAKYGEVKTECEDGVVRVLGVRQIKGKTEGLGLAFSIGVLVVILAIFFFTGHLHFR